MWAPSSVIGLGEPGPSSRKMAEEQEMYDDPDAEDLDSANYSTSSESDEDDQEAQTEEDDSEREEGMELDAATLPGAQTAETQIENDFNVLIQSIRQSDDSGSGMLSQSWDFNLKDQEAEFREDLRAASGVGKRGRKKGQRGRKAGPVLSPQVKSLIGEGNQAYVDSDISETIRIMQEVIRIEPRASSAWSVLAQCYADKNEHQKALQLRIMAAHLTHDSEEWDSLARQSKDLGYTQQALYCYGKVYRLDSTNVNAMWDRASLAKETGDVRVARHALLSLLRQVPHDLTVLDEIRPILIETSELELCVTLYEDAFAHYQCLHPSGTSGNAISSGGGFGLMELLVLADLHNTLGAHTAAVGVIRAGCRWLQGRADQRFWDVCEDDREWDVEGAPGATARGGDVKPGFYPLDINARHRLAVARIKMGDVDEGKMHASLVLAHDVMDYAPLFAEIADAFFERNMFADARPIYETLGMDAGTSSMYILLQTATCRRALGDLREASEVYEHVILADASNNDAKMKLAEIYEILNEPRKALDLVYQVIDARRRKHGARSNADAVADEPAGSLFEEKGRGRGKSFTANTKKLTPDQIRELETEREREVMRGYRRATDLWPRMLDDPRTLGQPEAEREWFFEAEKLVETFRETRRLFTTTREAFRGILPINRGRHKQTAEVAENDMASRLHLDLAYDSMNRKSKAGGEKFKPVEVFRGVHIDDWLTLFMQYAFELTKRDQYELASEVLSHIMFSNAYQNREAKDAIRLASIACASAARQYNTVVQHARKLISAYQFNNEPVRLLVASLASGLGSTDAFITNTLQKHMLREIKSVDAAVKNRDGMKWHTLKKRYFMSRSGKDDMAEEEMEDEAAAEEAVLGEKEVVPRLPEKDNPMLVAVYGQMSNAAKSYQSAIFYLLHAYDYCPEDPVVCLSLAIASIGRAMQRQSDNRHHLITQGMAFLSKYRNIRSTQAADEVEFNFGRAFQQLGLHSLAVRHYERVLQLANGKLEEDWGLAKEAAYNLSLIYVTTGATPLAQALYEQWLSI